MLAKSGIIGTADTIMRLSTDIRSSETDKLQVTRRDVKDMELNQFIACGYSDPS